jgi:hypothetical protein
VLEPEGAKYGENLLNTVLYVHSLSLEKGCISIMRNLSIEKSLLKNVRVQVVHLLTNVVQVHLLQAIITSHLSSNYSAQIDKFRLRLAYATTFLSCQGLTLDC